MVQTEADSTETLQLLAEDLIQCLACGRAFPSLRYSSDLISWLGIECSLEGKGEALERKPTVVDLPGGDASFLRRYQEAGYLGEALVNYLIWLFWEPKEQQRFFSLAEAKEGFQEGKLRDEARVFNEEELRQTNGWWIRHLPMEKIAKYLLVFSGDYRLRIADESMDYWEKAVEEHRGGLTRLTEGLGLAKVLFALDLPLEVAEDLSDEEREQLASAAEAFFELLNDTALSLDEDCYTKEQFRKMFKALKKKTELNDRELNKFLSLIVSGTTDWQDLKTTVPLIKRVVLVERVRGAIAQLR